ncbi:MAG: tRNA lysidine(34) synthetase TilS [Chlamydiota bacterium]
MSFSLTHLVSCVQQFLKCHWDGKSPLLLGYSGGPDSKALLYALLECGVKELHLAHIDHGWRGESGDEARALSEEADVLGCTFHLACLQRSLKGNQESQAREARLSFFHSLFLKIPFQALLLAHQGDDLAETVLKRVLEGAHLPVLSGMEPVSKWEGMPLWRPMLSLRREEILNFLQQTNLKPLIDPTNFDPSYLRARMRLEILPYLNRTFGKEVQTNLVLLSQRSAELKAYLDRKIDAKIERGPWGLFVEMSGMERIEQRHLIQKIAHEESFSWQRAILESVLDWIGEKAANKRLKVQSREIFIDRGILFILAKKAPLFEGPLELTVGKFNSGDWIVEVKPCDEPGLFQCNWKNVWTGHFSFKLPKDAYILQLGSPGLRCRKTWNERGVPAFLRSQIPFVAKKGEVVKEFLSGKSCGLESLGMEVFISFASRDSGLVF